MQLELESLCAACAHIAGTPELRLSPCVSPDLLETQPAGTSLPSPASSCHGSVRTAPLEMRHDTAGFLWQSHVPSQDLPARVSGAGVSGGGQGSCGFC